MNNKSKNKKKENIKTKKNNKTKNNDIRKLDGYIEVTDIKNKTTSLTNKDKIYNIKLIQPMKGKSGDFVFLIENNKNKYIMKVFVDKKSGNHEIKLHKKHSEIFSKNMLIPKIFSSGKIKNIPFKTDKKGNYTYILMEYLDKSIELTKYIRKNCTKNTKEIDPYNISLQFFYYLSMIHLNKVKHCDIHTKNILILKSDKDLKLNFSFLGGKKINTGKYVIKIIDFGFSKINKNCEKNRKFIGAVLNDMKYCKILNKNDLNDIKHDAISMAKQKLNKSYKHKNIINEDLYIFLKILRLLSKINNDKINNSVIEEIKSIIEKNKDIHKKIYKILVKE